MYRNSVVTTAVLFALTLNFPAQDADVKVTYERVALPLSRAMEELSKTSGTQLKVAQTLENEIIVIKVKDTPLSQLKAQIAKAAVGVWVKQDDGSEILNPDLLARTALSRKASVKRQNELQKSLTALIDMLRPPKKGAQVDPEEQFDMGFMGSGTGVKLIAHMAQNLRITDLMALRKGDRVVYSTQPNSMQRQLNTAGLDKAVAEFIIEHNKRADAAKNEVNDVDPAMAAQIEKAKAMFGDFMREQQRIDTPPAKILFAVERGGMFGFMGDGIQLNMIAFDAKGQVLATANHSLGDSMFDMATTAAADAGGPEEPVESTTPPKATEPDDPRLKKQIELTPLSLELKTISTFVNRGQSEQKPSKELMEKILRPDLYDPLSFEFSESLMALASAREDKLVAVLPDGESDFASISRVSGGDTVGSFLHRLEVNETITMERKDGWLNVSPIDPDSARAKRVDRRALAKFLGAVQDTVVPSLDALSAYATANPPPMETPVVMPHLMLLAPNTVSIGIQGMQDWSMLRLYGMLTQGERSALREGKPLAFSTLSTKCQSMVKDMVFGAESKLQVGPDKENALGLFGGFSFGRGSLVSSYKEEPTELMPNGLPGAGAIRLQVKPSHFVIPSDMKGGLASMFGALGPDEFAMLKYFSEEPKMAQMSGMMPKLEKFKLGNRDVLDFRFILAEDVTQKHTLMDQKISKDAATIGLDGLPARFMAEVDKQLKLYKEGLGSFLGMPGMMGGPEIPPR